jgi:hypothetical protein
VRPGVDQSLGVEYSTQAPAQSHMEYQHIKHQIICPLLETKPEQISMDDSPATAEASSTNFLILAEESNHKGKSIAEVCRESLRDFNPMVHVSGEKETYLPTFWTILMLLFLGVPQLL